jgi:hypothetical protein
MKRKRKRPLHNQTCELMAKFFPAVKGANPLALFMAANELIYISRHPELFTDWQLGELDV